MKTNEKGVINFEADTAIMGHLIISLHCNVSDTQLS